MANRYGAGIVSAAVAATGGGIMAEIVAGSTRYAIRSIEVTWATGTTGTIGIGRPGNTPAGGTSTAMPALDVSDTTGTPATLTSGWTTAPTVPSTFIKRTSIAASLGSGVIWNFEPSLLIVGRASRAEGLLLWVISLPSATSTTYNINIEAAD